MPGHKLRIKDRRSFHFNLVKFQGKLANKTGTGGKRVSYTAVKGLASGLFRINSLLFLFSRWLKSLQIKREQQDHVFNLMEIRHLCSHIDLRAAAIFHLERSRSLSAHWATCFITSWLTSFCRRTFHLYRWTNFSTSVKSKNKKKLFPIFLLLILLMCKLKACLKTSAIVL